MAYPTPELARRIQQEFKEMPGLVLTRWQAARLWALEPAECDAVIKALVDARILKVTRQGYVCRMS